MVAAGEWERKTERQGNLAAFLASSPLPGQGLKIRRLPMRLREVELGVSFLDTNVPEPKNGNPTSVESGAS